MNTNKYGQRNGYGTLKLFLKRNSGLVSRGEDAREVRKNDERKSFNLTTRTVVKTLIRDEDGDDDFSV
jgi:hypothetical protein